VLQTEPTNVSRVRKEEKRFYVKRGDWPSHQLLPHEVEECPHQVVADFRVLWGKRRWGEKISQLVNWARGSKKKGGVK